MEIKIFSPKEGGFIKEIKFNFEELKTEIKAQLKKYQGLAYTDDSIKDAKSDRATLNKFKKALNDKKTETKKLCLAPYTTFEAQIKELTGLVDEPLLAIDGQVKGYEDRKRQEKQQQIESFWKGCDSNVKKLVSLDRIFNPRWLNVTYLIAAIEKEIETFFQNTETEIATIEELNTEFEDQVIRVYLQSFSIAAALNENKKLLDQKAKREAYAEAQKAKREAEAKAREETKAQQQNQQPTEESQPEQQPAQQKTVEVERIPVPEVLQIDFRVHATREQLNKLKVFLNNTGIKYGHVPSKDKQAA